MIGKSNLGHFRTVADRIGLVRPDEFIICHVSPG
jgi:hypothetical protein